MSVAAIFSLFITFKNLFAKCDIIYLKIAFAQTCLWHYFPPFDGTNESRRSFYLLSNVTSQMAVCVCTDSICYYTI